MVQIRSTHENIASSNHMYDDIGILKSQVWSDILMIFPCVLVIFPTCDVK